MKMKENDVAFTACLVNSKMRVNRRKTNRKKYHISVIRNSVGVLRFLNFTKFGPASVFVLYVHI